MKFQNIHIKQSFQDQLPADPIEQNYRRQVENTCFSYVYPKKPKQPKLIHINKNLAKSFGFNEKEISSISFIKLVSGTEPLDDFKPFAMCYGGHQFGHWAGQLGDGRAIMIGEIDHGTTSTFLQLKGSGETPYSRSADGLAVLRSSIREYLCSEAMFHLNIATTRGLSLCLSGDLVYRDMLYDGNAAYEKGAIVCRTSSSFLRFGNYEIFTARKDKTGLKKLVDFTIKQHFTHISSTGKQAYIEFFNEVCQRTQELIIGWTNVGFVHGVMNTDNMSILGETIDYGPYGWLDAYDENWTPNTSDFQEYRYRFGQQGNIGLWNLLKLANALYLLIEDAEPIEKGLQNYNSTYENNILKMYSKKLGLTQIDHDFLETLKKCLSLVETDVTIFFRNLGKIKKANSTIEAWNVISDAFYDIKSISETDFSTWQIWFTEYLDLLKQETQSDQDRKTAMDAVNPKYILRNYMSQMAIEAAEKDNFNLIDELFQLIQNPFDEQPENEKWFAKRPDWAKDKPGCSQLSCSS